MASPDLSKLFPGLNDNIYSLAGPFLYGGALSALLMGVLIVQTIWYWARSSRDRWQYKVAVVALLCSSLASTGATLHISNNVFLANWGDDAALHSWPLSVFVILAMPTFSSFCSQGLFGYRLYALGGRSKWLGAGVVLLMLVNIASGMTAIIVEARDGGPVPINGNDLQLFVPIAGPEASTSFWRSFIANEVFLGISALTDLILTCCLTYLLLTRRRKTKDDLSRDTNKMIWRVVSLSVTTGGITALYSVGTLCIVFATVHKNNVDWFLILQLAHVYAIVCVSSLNLRRSMQPGHKGSSSSGNLSRSIGQSMGTFERPKGPDATSPVTIIDKPAYAFPPQRTGSQGSRDFSRPSTGKSMFEKASTFDSAGHRPTLSGRIQVTSTTHQKVEAHSPSQSPGEYAIPALDYFQPKPQLSSQQGPGHRPSRSRTGSGQRKPVPNFEAGPMPPNFEYVDPEKGLARPQRGRAYI